MFDARSILDAIISGSSEQTRNARESGELGDIMSDILGQMKNADKAGSSSRFERGELTEPNREDRRQRVPRNPLDDLFDQPAGGYNPDVGQSASPREDRSSGQGGPRSAQPDYDDMLDRVKDLVANNKAAAGALVGGLGGLLLGTRTGRSLTTKAVKIGGLALIGTLAYKAYQNYQQGASYQKDGAEDERFGVPELPPEGSGYEAEAMDNDDAILFIRTMAAAAMSDGQVDRKEQRAILDNLDQAGLDEQAMSFLANEFNDPASIEEIVSSVKTKEQAAKVYTAARIAIEPDTREERRFLFELSEHLNLDSVLIDRIDAMASGVKVR